MEKNHEIMGVPPKGETKPKDRTQVKKDLGRTAIKGATKGK